MKSKPTRTGGTWTSFELVEKDDVNRYSTFEDLSAYSEGDSVSVEYVTEGIYNNVSKVFRVEQDKPIKPKTETTSTVDERVMFLEADVEALKNELERVKGLISGK